MEKFKKSIPYQTYAMVLRSVGILILNIFQIHGIFELL